MPDSPTGAYVLTAFGECEELDRMEGEEVDGARLMETPDARWTLEVGIWAPSQEAAEALAEEVMSEAHMEYGQWHGWQVRPVASGQHAHG
jgi:hypothetical protein